MKCALYHKYELLLVQGNVTGKSSVVQTVGCVVHMVYSSQLKKY